MNKVALKGSSLRPTLFSPIRVLSELSPLAGSIPGPIAFGWVIDKACLLWQDQCGHQGSCFVYENEAMSRYMLIAGLTFKVRWPSGVCLHLCRRPLPPHHPPTLSYNIKAQPWG